MKTNLEQIKKLIEAFYEGTTSAEEEARLMHYFRSDEVDESLEDEKEYFLCLASLPQQQIEIPDTLVPRMDRLFDEIERKNPTRRRWIVILSTVAAVLVVVFLSIGYQQNLTVEDDIWASTDSLPVDKPYLANKIDTVPTSAQALQLSIDAAANTDEHLAELSPRSQVVKTKKKQNPPTPPPILTPEESNKAVSEALMMVARNLDASFSQLEEVSEVMANTANEYK